MSLDDVRNPHHAAALERGDLPLTVERQESQRIGRLLAKYMDPRGDHSERWWTDLGGKVLAHHRHLTAVFADYEANPHRIGEKDPIVLRRQQVSRLDDLDWALEEANYHKTAYEAAVDMVDRITARRLAEHDPDEVAADREATRAKEQRQDEAASNDAPRVAS